MADVVNTSTTISFDSGADDGGASPVIFEGHNGRCDVFNYICYRVYPSAVTDIRASSGRIEPTIDGGVEEKEEFLTFNNSDSASLRYPAHTMLATELRVYFDSDGSVVNADDKGVNSGKKIGLTFDRNNNTVKASEPFFGLVKATYQTTFKVWNYAPQTTTTGTFRIVGNTGSAVTEFGMLAALYKGGITTFNTSSRDAASGGSSDFEVYRVVSEALNNGEGAWEVHPTWPKNTWSDVGAPTENGLWMKYERVHEVGVLRSGHNAISIQQYHVRNEKPKFGSSTWKPKYLGQFISKDAATDTEYENAYATLDLEAIKADLKERYKNIEIEKDTG